jgi:hypothetical protein
MFGKTGDQGSGQQKWDKCKKKRLILGFHGRKFYNEDFFFGKMSYQASYKI